MFASMEPPRRSWWPRKTCRLAGLGGPLVSGLLFASAEGSGLFALVTQGSAEILDVAPRLGEQLLDSLLERADPEVGLLLRRVRLLLQRGPLRSLVEVGLFEVRVGFLQGLFRLPHGALEGPVLGPDLVQGSLVFLVIGLPEPFLERDPLAVHPPCFGLRFLEGAPTLFLDPRPVTVLLKTSLQFRDQAHELSPYRRVDPLLQQLLSTEHRLPLLSGFAPGPHTRPLGDAPRIILFALLFLRYYLPVWVAA